MENKPDEPKLNGGKTEQVLEGVFQDPKTGRFVKGNPGGGRPEGSVSIVEGIKRKLLEIEPENKKTYLELFLNSYFRKAIKDKDSALIRDMINRIDGMPKQFTDLTTNGKDLPTPLLGNVPSNLSTSETTEAE